MKRDLDRLMQERGLDAVLVADDEGYSAIRYYLSNGADISGGVVVKKRGDDPILCVSRMEVEEANKSGLTVVNWSELGRQALLKQYTDDYVMMRMMFWQRCLERSNINEGTVGIYGEGAVHTYIAMLDRLPTALPQYTFVGDGGRRGETLFDQAMVTKDEDEIVRIRSVANRTMQVLENTWQFIANHQEQDGQIVNDAGDILTIGKVKAFVRRALLDVGLEDTGMIFAQGRDAGFPHSRGEDDMALEPGATIVFDLFPREISGGYYHDVTRTWCLGHATPEAKELYEQVSTALDIAVEAFGVNKPTKIMETAVQDYFEAHDHPTLRSHPKTSEGYVHGLGHGVGLNIHEAPSISHIYDREQFQVGNVVTIEPGLYYPERNLGVRLEDFYIITSEGDLESLSTFRKDLVVPLKR